MGKLIGAMPKGFVALLFLFAISVALDFEYDIATIKGGGEVLGQSSVLIDGTLFKLYEVPVPIKLLDVVTLVLAIMVISRRKNILNGIRSAAESNAWRWVLGAAGLFFLWAAVSMVVHRADYTASQLVVMGLHLAKLVQVTLVGSMVALLVRERKIVEISAPLLLGFLVASAALIMNKQGLIDIGTVAGDRMETFGGIIIAIILFLHFHRVEALEGRMGTLKQLLYVTTVFIATVAILTSGKRGVELVFLACLAMLAISSLRAGWERSRILHYALIAGLVVSLPNVVADFHRSWGLPYNALHGTAYRGEIVSLYDKFKKHTSISVPPNAQERGAWKSEEFRIPFVSSIDYSGAERIGKVIKTLYLSTDNMWFGSGFWGAQYKYFLPDTGLQVLLETGLIGAVFWLILLYFIWHGAKRGQRFANGAVAVHALFAVVALCVFCNPFYMSRLMMMLMFFAFFCVHPKLRANAHD